MLRLIESGAPRYRVFGSDESNDDVDRRVDERHKHVPLGVLRNLQAVCNTHRQRSQTRSTRRPPESPGRLQHAPAKVTNTFHSASSGISPSATRTGKGHKHVPLSVLRNLPVCNTHRHRSQTRSTQRPPESPGRLQHAPAKVTNTFHSASSGISPSATRASKGHKHVPLGVLRNLQAVCNTHRQRSQTRATRRPPESPGRLQHAPAKVTNTFHSASSGISRPSATRAGTGRLNPDQPLRPR